MNSFRSIAGLFAAGLIIISSIVHSLVGWDNAQTALQEFKVSEDALQTVEIGWQFGAIAMFLLGCISLVTFVEAGRERPVSMIPTLLIGIVYVLFGFWALFASGNYLFFIYIVPGLLLGYASVEPRKAVHSEETF
jgi:hypothetical protein